MPLVREHSLDEDQWEDRVSALFHGIKNTKTYIVLRSRTDPDVPLAVNGTSPIGKGIVLRPKYSRNLSFFPLELVSCQR